MLAAIGDLYVGMGMGLVMGMGWDEGGVFVSCQPPARFSFLENFLENFLIFTSRSRSRAI